MSFLKIGQYPAAHPINQTDARPLRIRRFADCGSEGTSVADYHGDTCKLGVRTKPRENLRSYVGPVLEDFRSARAFDEAASLGRSLRSSLVEVPAATQGKRMTYDD